MTRSQRIRLGIVMRTAQLFRVPVCPHQSFLAHEGVEQRVGVTVEERAQGGRVLDFPARGVRVVGRVHN